jgi:UDP-N-acetylglucosamine 1-carboxyvinyltransferase
MTQCRVRPSGPLEGVVHVSGATKNSGLKQMAAALLAPGVTTLRNMPAVRDLDVMVDLLRAAGARVDLPEPGTVTIDASADLVPEAPYELVSRMRASFNVLGPLLARCGEARVALPGGDNIGSRKVDMHLRGLEAMGAGVDVAHGYVHARADVLHGARMVLEFPSVGATENLMCAAVLAKGTSVIENAAREPEVTDLAAFLDRMGAHVLGAGTSTIEIEGVERLTAETSEIMCDRVEAGTLLMACGIAGGEIELVGIRLEHLEIVVTKLCDMGMRVSPTSDGLWARGPERLRAVDIATLPYPGFATDFMPLAVALMTVAEGSAIVTENVYDGRFQFVDELARMGADVRTEGRHAIVRGVPRLSGAPVQASDVRAGAALVLAGLAADGETTVFGFEHVERGYPDLAGRLHALGADVERVAPGPGA